MLCPVASTRGTLACGGVGDPAAQACGCFTGQPSRGTSGVLLGEQTPPDAENKDCSVQGHGFAGGGQASPHAGTCPVKRTRAHARLVHATGAALRNREKTTRRQWHGEPGPNMGWASRARPGRPRSLSPRRRRTPVGLVPALDGPPSLCARAHRGMRGGGGGSYQPPVPGAGERLSNRHDGRSGAGMCGRAGPSRPWRNSKSPAVCLSRTCLVCGPAPVVWQHAATNMEQGPARQTERRRSSDGWGGGFARLSVGRCTLCAAHLFPLGPSSPWTAAGVTLRRRRIG